MRKVFILTIIATIVGIGSLWFCDNMIVLKACATLWAWCSVLNKWSALRWQELTKKYDQITTDMLKTFYEMRDRARNGNETGS